ncbi:Aste57867_12153 [Aphanomyces stellatus]|uniref:Aste57867_12153 protein n=1 Tax=Aphanomyces stellatus TaxID=120398 RepID=A0A485KV88_9STRA|nr:hypothetical protein As57867_012108 [Aphanomyces stellatus]VFT89007.1 Aste57867_12153 [Aphanomyces stellatus]
MAADDALADATQRVDVFDRAFRVWLGAGDDGIATRSGFEGLQLVNILEWTFFTVYRTDIEGGNDAAAADDDFVDSSRSSSHNDAAARLSNGASSSSDESDVSSDVDDKAACPRHPRAAATVRVAHPFPSLSVQQLWLAWFLDAPTPLRLRVQHIKGMTSSETTNRSCAKRVMSCLVDTGVHHGLFASEEALVDQVAAAPSPKVAASVLAALFDAVFGHLLRRSDDGKLHAARFAKVTFDHVASLKYTTFSTRIPVDSATTTRDQRRRTPPETSSRGDVDSGHVSTPPQEGTADQRPVITPKTKPTLRQINTRRSSLNDTRSSPAIPTMPPANDVGVFPTLTSRELWEQWFLGRRGDDKPLRHKLPTLTTIHMRQRFFKAHRLIQWLVQVAVTRGLIASPDELATTSRAALVAVFDRTFALALDVQPDGSIALQGLNGCTLTSVLKLPYTSMHDKVPADVARKTTSQTTTKEGVAALSRHATQATASGLTTKNPAEGDIFPANMTCRVLWVRWFHGDAPFCTILPHLHAPLVQNLLRRAALVVDELCRWVVDLAHAVSSDDPTTRQRRPRATDDGQRLERPGFQGYTYTRATTLTYYAVATKLIGKAGSTIEIKDERDSIAPTHDHPTSEPQVQGIPTDVPSLAHPETTPRWPITSCGVLWGLWFHGDPDAPPHVGPYRCLDRTSFPADAIQVLDWLIATAMDHGLTSSASGPAALLRPELLALFDHVFVLALGVGDDGIVTHAAFDGLPLFKVAQKKFPEVHAWLFPRPQWFLWADGSCRRAPQDWTPPTVPCRELWTRWFYAADDMGPLRLLKPRDISSAKARATLVLVRRVIRTLTDIAMTHLFVLPGKSLPAMDRESSLDVFERAFDVLMHNNPDGNLAGFGVGKIRPEKADRVLFSTVARALLHGAQVKRRHAEIEAAADDE